MTEEEKKLLKDIEQAILNIDLHPSGRRLPFVLKHGKHPLPKTNIGYIRNAI